jgi:hypothetical protein
MQGVMVVYRIFVNDPERALRLDNELILTTLSISMRVFMSNTNNLKDFNALAIKPGTEYKRLAKISERQKRERKEELYSYHTKKYKVCKKQ